MADLFRWPQEPLERKWACGNTLLATRLTSLRNNMSMRHVLFWSQQLNNEMQTICETMSRIVYTRASALALTLTWAVSTLPHTQADICTDQLSPIMISDTWTGRQRLVYNCSCFSIFIATALWRKVPNLEFANGSGIVMVAVARRPQSLWRAIQPPIIFRCNFKALSPSVPGADLWTVRRRSVRICCCHCCQRWTYACIARKQRTVDPDVCAERVEKWQ